MVMKKIFKKKHVAWNKISNEIGAEYKKGSFFKSDVLELNHRESIITLDYYTVSKKIKKHILLRLNEAIGINLKKCIAGVLISN